MYLAPIRDLDIDLVILQIDRDTAISVLFKPGLRANPDAPDGLTQMSVDFNGRLLED